MKLFLLIDGYLFEAPRSLSLYVLENHGTRMLIDTSTADMAERIVNKLKEINIYPIHKIFLTHGHWDHTAGLGSFLRSRSTSKKLKIVAHPHAFRKRRIANSFMIIPRLIRTRMYNFCFPKLPKSLQDKISIESTTEPYEITPYLKTTGEISDRKEKDCSSDKLKIKEERRYVKDIQLDDLSLILKTKEGIVIILGCGHSGVLNICARAKEFHPTDKIISIIGGTHLVAFKEVSDLEFVAKNLEEKYNKPRLYFSHCTGTKALKYFEKRFGKDIVKPFMVGDNLSFNC